MASRDIIVIGASAGGIEAISDLIIQFPEDMQVAVFIVVHISSESPNMLPMIFDRRSSLRCVEAQNDEEIKNGTIYVAPPDFHLILKNNHVGVTRGPKENRARPAIDPLFRSAALNYGPRVIGILLSGMLDDGVSGLNSIKQCGGTVIVQHPDDALFNDMPLHALANVEVDYNIPVSRMGSVIIQLMNDKGNSGKLTQPGNLKAEVEIAEKGVLDDTRVTENMSAKETGMVLTCPECNGPLIEINDDKILRFRCITGHQYTVENFLVQQKEAFEAALFAALRILQERANMLERMYKEGNNEGKTAKDLKRRAEESRKHATAIREIILNRKI